MRRVATAAASRLLRLPRHAARCPLRAACLPASAAPGAALLRVRIPSVPGEACDALEDALLGAGALSTSVADAQAGTSDETPFFHTAGEPVAPTWRWRSVELTALFSDAAAWEEAVPSARSAFPGLDESRIELWPALDADWEAAIRATFVPLRVSDTLWVVPDWDEPPSASATNVRLTPGLAFGTGEHATTRLCLRWLQETLRGGETLLDYGCGSGVLACGGLLLGAARAAGCDTDPVAVSASRANAALNGVGSCFEAVLVDPGLNDQPPRFAETGPAFDVVVANILLGPLLELQPRLARLVRPGGRIALSGLLASQAAEVRAAYAPHFGELAMEREGEWALLHGTRSE